MLYDKTVKHYVKKQIKLFYYIHQYICFKSLSMFLG